MSLTKAIISGFVALIAVTPAAACSVAETYIRPSNFELVQIADAIVVARAENEIQNGSVDRSVAFRIEAILKGDAPDRVVLPFASIGKPIASDLSDLSGSNPEGHMGPCNRTTFAQASRYLMFLERSADGGWRQLDFPFSRINEDYFGEDNAWMRTVRLYLRLQRSRQPMEQIGALTRMAETRLDDEGRSLADAERADIADHLRSISPWKPTAHLLDLHARVERGETMTPRPAEANGESGNLDEVARQLMGETGTVSPQGPQEARRLILAALAEGDHPDALPLFESLSARTDLDVDQRGLTLRYFARNGQYPRAYKWIEERLLPELGRMSSQDAGRLLAHVGDVQMGDHYGDGRERWRQDPHAKVTWPELAFALYRYVTATVGKDRVGGWLTDALSDISVSDYRARPELTVALAGAFDDGVMRWANQELSRPQSARSLDQSALEPQKHHDMLPLRVLASAWSDESISALRRAFCDGGERRKLAILALGQEGDELYESLLEKMAGASNLSGDERDWLLRAAIAFQARRVKSEPAWMADDPKSWLVTRLAQSDWPKSSMICSSPKSTRQ
ncbi:hypothetical protein [Blastomonas aquatica]|uniref:Uncharacterized protein n=1 Tax=Blastomonas aquatica TaxID=1510276 RepID=A0ABQ1J5N4_9SPHN|nr:hypothetical protein [Blastomonas aquatica]GGB58434.1 hypothetical protein GCM10010833_11510 [Blastomonas aquatica]